MPWLRFTEDYDFKPSSSVTIGYRSGQTKLVTTACANAAVSKRKAVRVKKGGARG